MRACGSLWEIYVSFCILHGSLCGSLWEIYVSFWRNSAIRDESIYFFFQWYTSLFICKTTRVSFWVSFEWYMSVFDVSHPFVMRACDPLWSHIRLFLYHKSLFVGLFCGKFVSFWRISAIYDESVCSSPQRNTSLFVSHGSPCGSLSREVCLFST